MIVLGIDPGYERCGFAVIDSEKGKDVLLFSECFKTDAKLDFTERLLLVSNELRLLFKKWRPHIISIETLFITKNQKTAMRVSEVRGALLLVSAEEGANILEYNPLTIKSAILGTGKGDKAQMERMVKMILKLDDSKKTLDDEFDAIAVALTASAFGFKPLK